jgi:hypothetical protein
MKTKNVTTLHLRRSIGRSPLRLGLPRVQRIWIIRGFILIPLALACFALSPASVAQLPPPAPDGGYPGGNTAEGDGALFSLTTGGDNTAIGTGALLSNTTGSFNTANGYQTLNSNTDGYDNTATGTFALISNTTGGVENTATGARTLYNNTSGFDNTATGDQALYRNTIGSFNTANGVSALYSNDSGTFNTANGFDALYSNTNSFNTANGAYALYSNNTGFDNTANGYQALLSNTTGFENTANGVSALRSNNTGARNTANGVNALFSNTTGGLNTATGLGALYHNTGGYYNTANGYQALLSNSTGDSNTAEGYHALQNNTGSANIGLGVNAGLNLTAGSHNIDIGNSGVAAESATIRIGAAAQTRAFVAGIRGVTTANANALPVVIDSAGQLGTMSSSKRFKKEIKPMDQTSEAILGLKPVTFHYKSDSTDTAQFGLIAEEVAKVNPDLVVRDDDGEIYTVRYEAVNAMLLNEFLKEHREVQEQKATITQLRQDLQSKLAEQQKQIEALTTGLQKVSAQLEASKPAPQMVDNNQ